MSNFRPAGLSDDESGSEDDFYEPRIKYYAPPQSAKKKIENTLQDAIINSNVDEVKELIENELKRNVNIYLDSGWTPLMHACFHAQENIVKLLLDKGADPNLNSDQVTPVMVACSNSSANDNTVDNIVTYLIEKDCLLNLGDKYGQTPLMRAITSGRVALVQKLLDMNVNIEMRDKQGWTAVFSAVHHNRPHILEMLIARGARLLEVDNSNRTVLEIALSHDYQNIIEILKQHIKQEEDSDVYFDHAITSWHDFYPGVTKKGKPSYTNEIPHLLYGMSCEKLGGIIQQSGTDLRTFLLLEENDMIKLGIELPFQRQRLLTGLHNFHTRAWKLKSVAGLTASKAVHFTVRSTTAQLKILVDYMAANPLFAAGEFSGPLGSQKLEKEWAALVLLLSNHGPQKTVEQWKHTWRDLKKKAREEGSKVRKAWSATGNLIPVPLLSEQSQKVLDAIGHECASGIVSAAGETGLSSMTFDPQLRCEIEKSNEYRRAQLDILKEISESLKTNRAVDGLTSLGSHLQQVYILEATLQYAVREYCRTYQGEKKSKPPDSELVQAATKMYAIIKKNKKQLKRMGLKLAKISKNNPLPADLLREKSCRDVVKNYMTEAILVCSLGFLVYQAKTYFTSILTK